MAKLNVTAQRIQNLMDEHSEFNTNTLRLLDQLIQLYSFQENSLREIEAIVILNRTKASEDLFPNMTSLTHLMNEYNSILIRIDTILPVVVNQLKSYNIKL
jgi:hypothetical protein